MQITLSKKILAGFLGCTLILLVVAIISFRNREQFLETNQWVNHTYEVLTELDQARIDAIEAETATRGFIITGKDDYLIPYRQAQADLPGHIANLKALVKDNPRQHRNIEIFERLTNDHLQHLRACIALREKDFNQAKDLVSTGESRRILNLIRETGNHAKSLEQTLLRERKQASEDDAKRFNLIFLFLLFTIVIVLLVVYFLIITNLRALKKAETEAANKNWNLTGTGELIRSIQGNKGVPELSQIIINRLASYLHASLGAIYVTEEGATTLKLTAAYATDKRNEPLFITSGEGLAGQAAAEKKKLLLQDIPDEYFKLNTSFGEVKPRMVLAVPFMFENNVIGVIELGTIHPFSETQLQYLDFVVDSIAIALVSAKSREKTNELLEETQRQGEELEIQQEELRQANEELMAKTESLEHSTAELKSQQDELYLTNQELEEKAVLLAQQKEKLEFAKSEIENKAGEIEVTSRYKSEFLANMSHELRTPLNSVLILAQLLSENKNGTLGKKELEFARNIHNSGADLLNLINEILDLSKIEAGKLQLDITEFTFDSIIRDLQAIFSEVAKSKSIDFTITYNANVLPPGMASDLQRVEQILKNLLSNAFKFTPKGGRISVIMDRPDPGIVFRSKGLFQKSIVAFSVTDTGVGIPEDKREIIFEAFQQADGSTKRKYGGTGLGLSISRELAHALGGEIRLESTEGRGSTFTLYLPLQFDAAFISSSDKKVEVKETALSDERHMIADATFYETDIADDRNSINERDRIILIIEDDASFAQVLLDLVRERQYKGIVAHHGSTGLSYARHYKPDAIFLDIKLPVMDGTEVLKCLKHDPELRHIPVQIISAYDKRKEGLEMGAFNFIQKPVTTTALKSAFEKIESFASKALKKLLIIEDNEQQNNAIRELIGNGDIKSYSAFSGREAFEAMRKETFDCIIIDLGLPDMSGFDLLEQIKADEALNSIPVIVYTGRDLKKEDTLRLNKLANTVVLKTVDSQERLLDETILFLHRVESRLPKEKQKMIRTLHKTDDILRDKKVLLVDDDMRNIYSLSNALEDEGIICLTAENGVAALEMLTGNPSIDLVLMDIMMPGMDGYEATQEIRKIEEFQKLPIIALTAKAMKGDKEKCLAAGMSDYISKPVNIQQLLSLMRVWLYR
jgi:CheY-like chemotaxis protein/signal transduction histidine kinase/CHASE3 domain sensor protein